MDVKLRGPRWLVGAMRRAIASMPIYPGLQHI